MSHAITALLLIRLQARFGEWCAVEELAKHFAMRPDSVREHLKQLHDDAQHGVRLLQDDAGQLVAAQISRYQLSPTAMTSRLSP